MPCSTSLSDRAYGRFAPAEDCWHDEAEGRWIDPFRPNIQPQGFSSKEEMIEDRRRHLAAVRRLFETLDVFVFTFGLTECWASKLDGAVFPVCPGVAGGTFDADRHEFHNLTVEEVLADMRAFLYGLRQVNPGSRVIFTVSPVPLVATAGGRHVLPATVYSKAVLRVAAETLAREASDVHYFPSFEIVTSTASRGRYFASDCREVTEEGVDHVMRLFFRHVAGGSEPKPAPILVNGAPAGDRDMLDKVQEIVEVICDEQMIDSQFAAQR